MITYINLYPNLTQKEGEVQKEGGVLPRGSPELELRAEPLLGPKLISLSEPGFLELV